MTKQLELTRDYDVILDSIISNMLLLDLAEETEDEEVIQTQMKNLQKQIDRRDACVAEIEALGGTVSNGTVFFS